MGRLDLDIVFRQTTSERIKCKICEKSVNGEDGYIKICSYNNNGWGNYIGKRRVICPNCFKVWMNNIATATDKKKESYNKLVKTKIIKSLK